MVNHNGSCKAHPNRYIFNHLPKTGGTSLLTICRNNLAASEVSPHLTEDDILSSDQRWEHYKLIAGHFSLLAQARLSTDRYSITLLRDPIQAILSTYTFWRTVSDSGPLTAKARELSFAGFVCYFVDAPAIIYNRMTHHFAAIGRDSPVDSGDGSSLLKAAKQNLAAFDFLCICEEFERSARLLCQELGWRLPVPLPHENRSRADSQCLGIDRQTMKILRDRNELDLELYAFGLGLFRERERACLNSGGGQPAPNSSFADRSVLGRNRFVPFSVPCVRDRRATIQFVSASWLLSDQLPRLELDVRFHTRIECPELIVGIAVYDSSGKNVWGTNTLIEKLQVKTAAGSDCHVKFVLRFAVPADRYFVTAALHELRNAGFHDHWIDRAAFFDVVQQSDEQLASSDMKLLEIDSALA